VSREEPVYSVAELTGALRRTLEGAYAGVRVRGEISNFRCPTSGHLYFALKDDRAQLRAVMFRSAAAGLRFLPGDGLEVEAEGDVTVYEPRGDMQLLVRRMQPSGIGALMRAFETLKRRLEGEGLFAAERKRPLPPFPRVIGIVTSSTGAAVRDLRHVIGRRWPAAWIVLRPVRVQGPEAAADIADGIADMNRWGQADVLIVGRGGGSLEDLWAFNEEVVARAVAASRIPVVSAVGHASDVTIADLVADVRAATPSAAAELVTPDQREVRRAFLLLDRKLYRRVWDTMGAGRTRVQRLVRAYGFRRPEQFLRREEEKVVALAERLHEALRDRIVAGRDAGHELGRRLDRRHPRGRVTAARAEVGALAGRLERGARDRIRAGTSRLEAMRIALWTLDPRSVMKRGYCLARDGATRRVVTAARGLTPGSAVTVQFLEDRFHARVDRTERGGPPELEGVEIDGERQEENG
jgi:exodeoxyribonuclease VII large subunit